MPGSSWGSGRVEKDLWYLNCQLKIYIHWNCHILARLQTAIEGGAHLCCPVWRKRTLHTGYCWSLVPSFPKMIFPVTLYRHKIRKYLRMFSSRSNLIFCAVNFRKSRLTFSKRVWHQLKTSSHRLWYFYICLALKGATLSLSKGFTSLKLLQ